MPKYVHEYETIVAPEGDVYVPALGVSRPLWSLVDTVETRSIMAPTNVDAMPGRGHMGFKVYVDWPGDTYFPHESLVGVAIRFNGVTYPMEFTYNSRAFFTAEALLGEYDHSPVRKGRQPIALIVTTQSNTYEQEFDLVAAQRRDAVAFGYDRDYRNAYDGVMSLTPSTMIIDGITGTIGSIGSGFIYSHQDRPSAAALSILPYTPRPRHLFWRDLQGCVQDVSTPEMGMPIEPDEPAEPQSAWIDITMTVGGGPDEGFPGLGYIEGVVGAAEPAVWSVGDPVFTLSQVVIADAAAIGTGNGWGIASSIRSDSPDLLSQIRSLTLTTKGVTLKLEKEFSDEQSASYGLHDHLDEYDLQTLLTHGETVDVRIALDGTPKYPVAQPATSTSPGVAHSFVLHSGPPGDMPIIGYFSMMGLGGMEHDVVAIDGQSCTIMAVFTAAPAMLMGVGSMDTMLFVAFDIGAGNQLTFDAMSVSLGGAVIPLDFSEELSLPGMLMLSSTPDTPLEVLQALLAPGETYQGVLNATGAAIEEAPPFEPAGTPYDFTIEAGDPGWGQEVTGYLGNVTGSAAPLVFMHAGVEFLLSGVVTTINGGDVQLDVELEVDIESFGGLDVAIEYEGVAYPARVSIFAGGSSQYSGAVKASVFGVGLSPMIEGQTYTVKVYFQFT